jgi:hypothetical protein
VLHALAQHSGHRDYGRSRAFAQGPGRADGAGSTRAFGQFAIPSVLVLDVTGADLESGVLPSRARIRRYSLERHSDVARADLTGDGEVARRPDLGSGMPPTSHHSVPGHRAHCEIVFDIVTLPAHRMCSMAFLTSWAPDWRGTTMSHPATLRRVAAVAASAITAVALAVPPAQADPSEPTLRSEAPRDLKIGSAVWGQRDLLDYDRKNPTEFQSILASEFNSLTPENDMKWAEIHPEP